MLQDVKKKLETRKKEAQRKKNENALLKKQIKQLEQEILDLSTKFQVSREALEFLEELANGRRGAIKNKVESIITEAVRLIYGESYKVEFSYSMKNNRSCLEINMVRSLEEGDVKRGIEGYGGGMADTISVPLRLMVLLGSKQTDKICVLDECWKHMDNERIDLVGKFLQMMAKKLGIQILMSSHHQALKPYADKIYELTEENGVSKVTVVVN